MGLADIIGYTAAGIGSVMFLPQAIRSWRTKDTKGLSLSAYTLFALVSLLWLVYGIMLMAGSQCRSSCLK